MAKIIISITVGSILAWVFGFGITDVFIRDLPTEGSSFGRLRQQINHGHAYVVCALIVFACAVPIGLGLPLFPERFEPFDKILRTFFVLFIPASIGVWCALPKRKS